MGGRHPIHPFGDRPDRLVGYARARAFSVGAVAGWGLIDYLFPPKASQATFDRVSALAAQYGLEFQIPDAGRTPWLEEELRAIEDALGVYDVVLSGGASPRAVGLGLESEQRPWTLENRRLRKVSCNAGFWDPTNAFAGPRSGVSVCGNHIARAAVGPVFGRRMLAGILVHELGHALLSHEVRPFQAEVERQLQRRNHSLHNFWDISADKTRTSGGEATPPNIRSLPTGAKILRRTCARRRGSASNLLP